METPTLNRDQLLTLGDLSNFKTELLKEITDLFERTKAGPVKQWLRTSEVRQMMGVSSATLQTLRITRKLTFSKVGGIIFYKYDDVLALLEENSVPKAEL